MATLSIPRYPWTAAFVSFCHGTNLEDIAVAMDIPLDKLKTKCSNDQWAKHRDALPMVVHHAVQSLTGSPAELANMSLANSEMSVVESAANPAAAIGNAKLLAIMENRKANLSAWERLRAVALKQIAALEDDSLRIQKAFHHKGMVVTHDAPPGPGDWVNIATFLQTIANGTYRALGDVTAQEKPGQDAAAGTIPNPTAPAITIILPRAISTPREEREVIDLQHVKVAPEN